MFLIFNVVSVYDFMVELGISDFVLGVLVAVVFSISSFDLVIFYDIFEDV